MSKKTPKPCVAARLRCFGENERKYCQKTSKGFRLIRPAGDNNKHVRDLREDRDLSQREVSKILNCSQQVYSNYELGQRDIPTAILIKLSKYYNVSVDFILGLTDNPEINR